MKTAIDALKGKLLSPARIKKLKELRISSVELFLGRCTDKDARHTLGAHLGLNGTQMLRAIAQAKVLLGAAKPRPKPKKRTAHRGRKKR